MTQALPSRTALAASSTPDAVIISSMPDIASTGDRQAADGSNPNTAQAPRMRSQHRAPHPSLAQFFADIDTQDDVNHSASTALARQSPDQPRLDQLARHFERFFWRPSRETRAELMKVVMDISQSEYSLEGTDASSLVSRILRSRGLFASRETGHATRESVDLGVDDVRSAVSATLHCLANSSARLFNPSDNRSLAYMLPAADDNGLLPALEALINRDMMFCGKHRVLDSIWSYAEHTGLPLPTIPILLHLSERLRYPIPDDVPLLRSIQLIQHWQQQPPSSAEQDDFESQLCAMTGPETSPGDFEDLLEMAFELGFCFADESLHCLIEQLIVESEYPSRRDQYLIKLDAVLTLTGVSANDIAIDEERALSRAVRRGDYRLFALLVRHGASPEEESNGQPSVHHQLLRQRREVISDIDQVVKAQPQFTRHQYQKITSTLLAQLHRNERMLRFLESLRNTAQ